MTFQEFYNLIIKEDAVDNIELKGDWESSRKYGYDAASIGILKNKNSLERIKNKWSKLEVPVDIYIVKGPKVHQFTEIGRVDSYFVRDKLKLNLDYNQDSITIIFTNNKGDEKIPMTPWTMAHRFGHALARDTITKNGSDYFWKQIKITAEKLFTEVGKVLYNRETAEHNYMSSRNADVRELKRHLAQALGTFKSARDKNLRNDNEFINELIAQYIITGKVTLNRNLPDILPLKHAWGKAQGPYKRKLTPEQEEDLQDTIEQKEAELNYDIDNLFTSNIGNIFVM
jgi:hypothetical protein